MGVDCERTGRAENGVYMAMGGWSNCLDRVGVCVG